MKRIGKVLVSIVMMLTSIWIVPVAAEEKEFLYGWELSGETVEMLKDGGIEVTDDTIIQLASELSEKCSGKAIVVTNKTTEGTVKNVVAVMDKERNLVIQDINQLKATGYNNQPISYTENSIHIIMYGNAYYYAYSDGTYDRYIRPMQASFSYVYKSGYSNATVSYLKLRYATIGLRYSYPGFVLQSSNYYSHVINVQQNNPLDGTIYNNYSPLSSGYTIYAYNDPSGMTSGMYVTVSGTVDGVSFSYNFQI